MSGPSGAAAIASRSSSSAAIEHLLQAGMIHLGDAVQQRAGADELLEPRSRVAPAVLGELERGGERLARDRIGALDAALEQQLAPVGHAVLQERLLVGVG